MTHKYYVITTPTVCQKCGKSDYSNNVPIDTTKTIKRFNNWFWAFFTPALIFGVPRVLEFLSAPSYYFNNVEFLGISMFAISCLLISLFIKLGQFSFEEKNHFGRVCKCCGNTISKN